MTCKYRLAGKYRLMSMQLLHIHPRGLETWSLQTFPWKGKAPASAFPSVALKQPQWLHGAEMGVTGVRFREQFDSWNLQTTCKQFLTQVLSSESQPGHFHWRFTHALSSGFGFHITANTAILFTDCISTINHRNVRTMGWYIPRTGLQAKWWMKKDHSRS